MKNVLKVVGITITLTAIVVAMRARVEPENLKSRTYIDRNGMLGSKNK